MQVGSSFRSERHRDGVKVAMGAAKRWKVNREERPSAKSLPLDFFFSYDIRRALCNVSVVLGTNYFLPGRCRQGFKVYT